MWKTTGNGINRDKTDAGRHVTSVFQGPSLSCSVGRVGENPGNKVAFSADSFCANVLEQVPNHRLGKRRQFFWASGGGKTTIFYAHNT